MVNYVKQIRRNATWRDNDRLFRLYDESGVDGGRSVAIRNRIVEANRWFVKMVARHYYSPDVDIEFDDILQEGILGFIKAVEKFDRTRKKADGTYIKFTSYAVWWINKS